MSIRNPARLMALISFSLMPSHLSAAAAEGEWSSEKPWWVYTVSNVAQRYSSPSTYSGESKHSCSNSTGWWALENLNCAD